MPLIDIATVAAELIAIPSDEDELAVQQVIAAYLRQLGFVVRFQEIYQDRPNLIATRGEGGPLLCTHADTFPPFDHPDALTMRRVGDRLIGRGANDTKGQIAALLHALEASVGPCEVAITVDEERDGLGSLHLTPRSRFAVILEPTRLRVCPVQGGYIEARATVRGASAHWTVNGAGENAILAAYRFYAEAAKLPHFVADHPLLGRPPQTLGVIRGGERVWTAPPEATIEFAFGVWPTVRVTEARAALVDLAARHGVTLRFRDVQPGFALPVEHPLTRAVCRAVETAGRAPTIGGMVSWTDAQYLVNKGVACVVFGAGDLATAHSAHEWVNLSDLEFLSRALVALIDGWIDPAEHAGPDAPTALR